MLQDEIQAAIDTPIERCLPWVTNAPSPSSSSLTAIEKDVQAMPRDAQEALRGFTERVRETHALSRSLSLLCAENDAQVTRLRDVSLSLQRLSAESLSLARDGLEEAFVRVSASEDLAQAVFLAAREGEGRGLTLDEDNNNNDDDYKYDENDYPNEFGERDNHSHSHTHSLSHTNSDTHGVSLERMRLLLQMRERVHSLTARLSEARVAQIDSQKRERIRRKNRETIDAKIAAKLDVDNATEEVSAFSPEEVEDVEKEVLCDVVHDAFAAVRTQLSALSQEIDALSLTTTQTHTRRGFSLRDIEEEDEGTLTLTQTHTQTLTLRALTGAHTPPPHTPVRDTHSQYSLRTHKRETEREREELRTSSALPLSLLRESTRGKLKDKERKSWKSLTYGLHDKAKNSTVLSLAAYEAEEVQRERERDFAVALRTPSKPSKEASAVRSTREDEEKWDNSRSPIFSSLQGIARLDYKKVVVPLPQPPLTPTQPALTPTQPVLTPLTPTQPLPSTPSSSFLTSGQRTEQLKQEREAEKEKEKEKESVSSAPALSSSFLTASQLTEQRKQAVLTSFAASTSDTSSSASSAMSEEEQMLQAVERVYREKDPKKLDEIPKLVAKYTAKVLFEKLAKKYNITDTAPYLGESEKESSASSGAAATAAPPSTSFLTSSSLFGTTQPSLTSTQPAQLTQPSTLSLTPSKPAQSSFLTQAQPSTQQSSFLKPQGSTTSPWGSTTSSTTFATTLGTAPATPSVAELQQRIHQLYSQHNPQKLSELPSLLQKYAGRELELLRKIESKYLPANAATGTGMATTAGFTTNTAASPFAQSLPSSMPSLTPGFSPTPAQPQTQTQPQGVPPATPSIFGASPNKPMGLKSMLGGTPNMWESKVKQQTGGVGTPGSTWGSGGWGQQPKTAGPTAPAAGPFAPATTATSPFAPPSQNVFAQPAQQQQQAPSFLTQGMAAGGMNTGMGVGMGMGMGAGGMGGGDSQLAQRIQQIYAQHNPQKLSEVPSLLQKYAGRELELLAKLEKKYGSAPAAAPLASPFGAPTQPSLFGQRPAAAPQSNWGGNWGFGTRQG